MTAEIELVQKQIGDANEAVRLAEQLAKTTTDLSREARFLSEIEKQITAATLKLKNLKLDYHRSQASRLAAELATNEACPVCGSLDHPTPASGGGTEPSTEDLENQETALATLNKSREKIETQIARLESHAKSATNSLRHILPDWGGELAMPKSALEDLQKKLKLAQISRDNAANAQKNLAISKQKLESLLKQIETAEAESQILKERLTQSRFERESTKAGITQLDSIRLQSACGEFKEALSSTESLPNSEDMPN